MVKIDCHDCEGCSECCHGLCKLIILDPYDVYQMEKGEGQSFQELLEDKLELNVSDGIVLPNLKTMEGTDHCAFLNEDGMCRIHGYRPGICRLYPLGRYHEEHKLHYILQVGECERKGKTKVKISKWLGIPNLACYEAYVLSYHDFLKDLRVRLPQMEQEEAKNWSMYLLRSFFVKTYDFEVDFFEQFASRLADARMLLDEQGNN